MARPSLTLKDSRDIQEGFGHSSIDAMTTIENCAK